MNISNQTIEFEVDGTSHHAYMAWDRDVDGPRPGVMVIHEWWGLNDYIRGRANMLAELDTVVVPWTCIPMARRRITLKRQES